MKKFLKYTILFILPIILAAIFFEIYLRQIDTSYTEKEKGIILDQKKIEVITLGNSHGTFGIDPNEFNLYTYNLANVIQSLYYDKRIALKHIDKLTNLKYVIISIDHTSFYYSGLGSREAWSYYGNGVEYKNSFPLASKISYLKGYSYKLAINFLKKDLSRKYKKIKALDVPDGTNLDFPISKGWFFYQGTNEEGLSDNHNFQRANSVNNPDLDSPEKLERVKDLEDFIQQLKIRNIKPILINIPCYSPFVKMLNPILLKRNELDINKLAKKHDIPYWNYLNYPLLKTDFYDCDHLNKYGAKKFSKALNLQLNTFSKSKEKIGLKL